MIEDLNSTNGIYVKSKRVRRHNLNDGDVVLVGQHEIMYMDERAARVRGTFTETVPGLHKSMDGPLPVRSGAAANLSDEELDEDAEASPPG